MRNNTISLIGVLLLTAIVIYIVLPIDHPVWLERFVSGAAEQPRDLRNLKLGLDLQGGTQVLLESDLPEGATLDEGAMETAKIIIEQRVNGLGVAEAVVQQQGVNRIIVELPGVDNPDQAVQTIRSTGQLEFVDPQGAALVDNMVINTTGRPTAATDLQQGIVEGRVTQTDLTPFLPDQVFNTVMTGNILRNAVPSQDDIGRWQIDFVLTSDGSEQFFDYTTNHVGQALPIVLDGRVLSAPQIISAIRDNGQITGNFTQEEANSLAIQMRYGALPVPLKVIDVRTIGASLGQSSVEASVRAGIIGMIGVLLFMLIIYRLPGFLADLSLIIYVLLNLAIFKLIPVTLTLPGIAGFLLSIGMAVDANILIFERMKEELRVGRSIRLAVEAGFSRAWPAIRDGNLSTLISCAVLFWFGNNFGASVVKGFAVTLAIGVILSMLTAVFITRTLMRSSLNRVVGSAEQSSRALLGH